MTRSADTPNVEDDFIERVSTGDPVLDSVLSGGFPRGSLILVSGNPGTGKTTLTAGFLYSGAKDGAENGIYVSFSEGKRTFYKNMTGLGLDFARLEDEGHFRFMEMFATTKEGIGEVTGDILNGISELGAKRLVIDSYSVMSQALGGPYEGRQVLHNILGKIVRTMGCTTVVIGEQSTGDARIGDGAEEFVADGVLNLKHGVPREMEILKMRGTKIGRERLIYRIGKNGFEAVTTSWAHPRVPKKWKPIPDSGDLLSTGSPDVDRAIGGGFPRGAYVLLEVESDVAFEEFRVLSDGICLNFISQGRGVIVSATSGQARDGLGKAFALYLPGESVDQYLRVVDYNVTARKPGAPAMLVTDVTDDQGYQGRVGKVYAGLKKVSGGQPIFHWVGYDTLASSFAIIPDKKVVHQIGFNISENWNGKDLTFALARPSLKILATISDIVNWHLKVWKKDGVIFLKGVKPETRVYATSSRIDLGYPVMSLKELS